MSKENLDFGDYALIEQKRYVGENEMFMYKVIGSGQSNCYVNVPVQSPPIEIIHDEIVDVVSCICCGIQETEVRKYRLIDVKPLKP